MYKAIRNDDAIYKTVEQVMKETNICRRSLLKLASEADSLIRIGRIIRINTSKFYEYLEKEYKG